MGPSPRFLTDAWGELFTHGGYSNHHRAHPAITVMNPARKRILLVEEDPVLSEVTAFRLELLGFEVMIASTIDCALAQVAEVLPDIAVVGCSIGGVDGLDLVDRLSNDVRTSSLPIMYLSTKSDLHDVQRAFTAGVDDFLVTPYDPLVLERKINRLAQVETVG